MLAGRACSTALPVALLTRTPCRDQRDSRSGRRTPSASTSTSSRRAASVDDQRRWTRAAGGGWWRRRPTRRGTRQPARLRVPARRRRRHLPDPRSAVAAARRARAEPHRSTRRRTPGATPPGAGPQQRRGRARRRRLRAARRHVHPEGTLDAAISRLDHLVDARRRRRRADAGRRVPGPVGLGLRRGRACMPCTTPTAVRPRSSASSTPATQRGLGVCLDVVYNHLGPSGNYLSRFGPYFTDRHVTPWGTGGQPRRRRASDEVRRFVVDNALRWFRDFHVDALRLDAVHELRDDSRQHVLAELADEVAALSRELGPPARPDRRERPQRPASWSRRRPTAAGA